MTEVSNESDLKKYGIWLDKASKQVLGVEDSKWAAEFLLRSNSPKLNSALTIFQGNIFNIRDQEYVYFLTEA